MIENAIETLLQSIPFSKLEKAAHELSASYRNQSLGIQSKKPFMLKEEHKIAYLGLRMPATYAALIEVFNKIPCPVDSLLDIGSGPGTALMAAENIFPQLTKSLLIEKDPFLISLGKKINPKAIYKQADILSYKPEHPYNLIAASYSLSELPQQSLESVLETLWNASNPLLCIVEPGTPYGFQTILHARSFLISKQAFILAPCSHEQLCPWKNTSEWCHFSVRLNRTPLQKRLKSASLGYEDEKYSYLIASKIPLAKDQNRIVKTPVKRSGFIDFTLCNSSGIQHQIFTKKQGEIYQAVKNLDWGGSF